MDDVGNVVPDRHIGEVAVRWPSVAAGYHDDAAATVASFTARGLRTGDESYLADGVL